MAAEGRWRPLEAAVGLWRPPRASLQKPPEAEFLVGHETREGGSEMGGGAHAVTATWAFGGAPYVATKRAMGVPK